jgi:aspartate/methionine/tyrosine aminotransferase
MAKMQENFNSGVNAAAQYAAVYALEHRELTEGIRESFRQRRETALAGIRAIPGMRCAEPKGAFYLFPDIRAFGLDSLTFCNRLLEEAGVVCIPGSAFGDMGEGFIRIAYTANQADIEEAMRRMKDFCAKL